MKRLNYLIIAALFLIGCDLHPRTDTNAPTQKQLDSYSKAMNESSVPETELVCEEDGKPLECTFDDDCCEGFVCVKDPALGKYTKTCIEDK